MSDRVDTGANAFRHFADDEIPCPAQLFDMTGKVVLITGGSRGMGRAMSLAFAEAGADVIVTSRKIEACEEVAALVRARGQRALGVACHVGKWDDIDRLVKTAYAEFGKIDVLINNAGLAGKPGLTAQGFQLTFGVNHLGHFLLTELLLERLKGSAPARVVNVASKAHFSADSLDWDRLRTPTTTTRSLPDYNVSKLCNVLHAKELARRLEGTGVTTYSLHPGVIASDVWRNVPWPFRSVMKAFMKSNEEGAQTTLHCATSEAAAAQSGLYYDEREPKEPNRLAHDEALQDALEAKSREWVDEFMDRSSTAGAPAGAAADTPPRPR